VLSFDECVDLDRADVLATKRDLFDLPDDLVYLDGNSLGPPLRSTRHRIDELLGQWRDDLISGWFDRGWAEMPVRVGKQIAPLIGADPGSVVVSDSTSVNLFKAAMVGCDFREGDILTDSGNFPTDLYVLAEVARRRQRRLVVVAPEEVSGSMDGIGLMALTQVDYRTGRLHDLPALTASAHNAGALSLWDLSHTAGVMEIEVTANEVDLAVGCGYKYLNGGPGAPAYIYVAPNLVEQAVNPITGWFGHADPFLFSTDYVPAPGIRRMQVGTPGIASMVGLAEALTAFDHISLAALRQKSIDLTAHFIELVDQELGGQFEVVTPRSAAARGSQVSLRHPRAGELMTLLQSRRVVGDFRPPDLMRFGLVPLFNRFTEAWRAVAAISECLRSTA
jgi:kynureninase